MTMMALPFVLIWIGVVIRMPTYYYFLIGAMTIFDVSVAFLTRGDDSGSDNRGE